MLGLSVRPDLPLAMKLLLKVWCIWIWHHDPLFWTDCHRLVSGVIDLITFSEQIIRIDRDVNRVAATRTGVRTRKTTRLSLLAGMGIDSVKVSDPNSKLTDKPGSIW
jgi:hypothetical protein